MERHPPNGSARLFALVDFDNLRRNVTVVGEEGIGTWLMDHLRQLGTVCFAFVLCDFRTVDPAVADDLSAEGFTLIHCPKTSVAQRTGQKDMVDTSGVELIHRVLEYSSEVDTIALISGDRDFCAVLGTWRMRGKTIIVLGHASVSHQLRTIASRVIDMRSNVEQAIHGFNRILRTTGQPEDFGAYRDPTICLIRDGVAAYLRFVWTQYYNAGKSDNVTRQFLFRGLKSQLQFRTWSNNAIGYLLDALIETIFARPTSNGETRVYSLECHHPFVVYACVSASVATEPAPVA